VFSDLLKRYLLYRGYNVKHVIKITDVDDHIIKQIGKNALDLREFTDNYFTDYVAQLRDLNLIMPDYLPRVTDHIDDIVNAIKILEDKGFTYRVNGSIYFDISKFPAYGNLGLLDNQAQSRINAKGRLKQNLGEKKNPNDFCVWKAWTQDDGSVFWDTEIGKGRPGWHIECSVLSMKYLGETIDIHVGGISHIFPHHTNEIAQSEAITGKRFVRYWVHHDYLIANDRRMSKEDGNLITLADIKEEGFDPIILRLILLQVHYQQKLNFKFEKFAEAYQIAQSFVDFLVALDFVTSDRPNVVNVDSLIQQCRDSFEEGMDNNVNFSESLSALFGFMSNVNSVRSKINVNQADKIRSFILEIDTVLGFVDILYTRYKKKLQDILDAPYIKDLLKQREQMRQDRNYAEADKIRERLREYGILLQDKSSGGFHAQLIEQPNKPNHK